MYRNIYLTDAYTLNEVHLRIARGKMNLLIEAQEQKEIDLCYKELEEYNSDHAKARRAGFEDYEDMIYNRGQY
jgi:hypothetical protein